MTSGLSTLNEDQIAERGARLARRDDREYREYLSEEQRSQTGCPAREAVLDQRGQATSTTLLDPQVEIPEFHHGFQVVRMRDEEMRGEHFGDHRTRDRQRG